MKTKKIFYIGIILSFLVSAVSAAPATQTETDIRREQMRKEAQATYAPISKILSEILATANTNQKPAPDQLQKAAALLESSKRNVAFYDGFQKAGYMLLQSWVAYYQGDPVTTMNSAVRACKENPASGDAWATQTLFSMVHGRLPIEPKDPRPATQNESRRPPRPQRPRRTTEMGVPETSAEPVYDPQAPYGQPGTLSFNPATLQKEFLRQRFNQMEFTTADSKKITYTPTADTLCILFWRAEEAVETTTPETIDMAAPALDQSPVVATEIKGPSLEDQRVYFKALIGALGDKKEVKFVEINTNIAAFAKEAVKDWKPICPAIIASDPQSGATPFVRLLYQSPFMAIVDTDGKVRYAGPADGFAPAFILTHITGVPIEVKPSKLAPQAETPLDRMPGEFFLMMPGIVDPNQKPVPMDPNGPQAALPAKQYRQLPYEQQLTAEKKIQAIRDFFIKAPRTQALTYKNGIDMCREVMQDYPGTQYADEARQLLRQVPEHKRATYNITNEELGL